MRYNFSMLEKHFWKDLFMRPEYLFGMWGFGKSVKFIIKDTYNHII